jgi:SAM-dependent methyltransferase
MPAPRPPSLLSAIRAWWQQSASHRGQLATLRTLLAEVWGFLRDSTPEQRRRRYGDVEYDWDHRVDTTSATVGGRNRLLGVFHSAYQPTEPGAFHEMLSALKINFADFIFLDIGSGKGRTLMMASDYPFRRIIGVELLPELNRVAQENLRKYSSPKQKCFALESACLDARDFVFPAEPMLLYLFHPLPESGLAVLLKNLEQSLQRQPRPLFVLYHNPLLEELLARTGFLARVGGTHQYSIYRCHSRPTADPLSG